MAKRSAARPTVWHGQAQRRHALPLCKQVAGGEACRRPLSAGLGMPPLKPAGDYAPPRV